MCGDVRLAACSVSRAGSGSSSRCSCGSTRSASSVQHVAIPRPHHSGGQATQRPVHQHRRQHRQQRRRRQRPPRAPACQTAARAAPGSWCRPGRWRSRSRPPPCGRRQGGERRSSGCGCWQQEPGGPGSWRRCGPACTTATAPLRLPQQAASSRQQACASAVVWAELQGQHASAVEAGLGHAVRPTQRPATHPVGSCVT
jgi:hypothetical protein